MIIIDASAVAKLALHESESQDVLNKLVTALKEGETVAAPEICLIESLNAIWKQHAILKSIEKKELEAAIDYLYSIWSKIHVINSYLGSRLAMEMALENKISVYDSIYLAQCKLNFAKLLSFDKRLISAANSTGINTVELG
jgi:predicted nucleic acid-binding protein